MTFELGKRFILGAGALGAIVSLLNIPLFGMPNISQIKILGPITLGLVLIAIQTWFLASLVNDDLV